MASGFKTTAFKAPSGIRITDVNATRTSTQVIHPFKWFLNNLANGIFKLFIDFEVQRFPSSAENSFRESSITLPAIGPALPRTRVEQQTIINRNDPTSQISDNVRVRSSFQISFVLIIWITSFLIAYSPEIRTNITPMLMSFGHIPTLLSELLKRTRTGISGRVRVLIGISYSAAFNVLCATYPELKNSIMDPVFLNTTIGRSAYIAFLSSLKSNEHNYIPFVEASKQTIPPIESGSTITATGITVLDTDEFFSQGTLGILPSTSYPDKTVPPTHLTDIYLVNGIHSSTDVANALNGIGDNQNINTNITSSIDYVFNRVLGLEPNPGYRKSQKPTAKPSTEASDSDQNATSAAETVTKMTRGSRFTSQTNRKSSPIDLTRFVSYLMKPKQRKLLNTIYKLIKSLSSPEASLQALIA